MRQARLKWWHGWAPLVLMPIGAVLIVPAAWPRWTLMWTLAFAIYCGCKWLTWRRTPIDGVPWWRHTGYLIAWPGLDAAGFLSAHAQRSPAPREWLAGFGMFALGLVLLFVAARPVDPHRAYQIGWVGMAAIALVLHFGIFQVLSCAWRSIGIDARPLMQRPMVSRSLAEFWGRRWNTAFRDVTHRFLFRPLTARLGPRWAIVAGFVFSGIVHDLVISVPASGGYGGPTVFFALQAAGLTLERTRIGRQIGLGHGWKGWGFTMVFVLAPACLLFHPPFVERIVVPFVRALRTA